MTKKEMAKAIGDELGIRTELAKAVIQRTFAAIIETLKPMDGSSYGTSASSR